MANVINYVKKVVLTNIVREILLYIYIFIINIVCKLSVLLLLVLI